ERQLLFEFLAIFGFNDRVFGFAADQDFIPFSSGNDIIDVLEDGLVLALLEIIKQEGAFFVRGTGARQAAEDEFAVEGEDIIVIAGLERQHNRAPFEIRQVNFDGFGRLVFLILLLLVFVFVVGFFVLVVVFGDFLIVFLFLVDLGVVLFAVRIVGFLFRL